MGLKVTPDCAIVAGGSDVSARLRDRLIAITVTDNSGEEADTLEIELDDRGYEIEAPRRGVTLGVSLGYRGDPLLYIGSFVVDEVEPAGPPDRLIIRAKSADMRDSLKAARSRAWRDTTVGEIVSSIAAEHGLSPAVAAQLAATAVAHRDQTNESDLHFLTRLGRDFGAVAAAKDGRLVFAPAGAGQSASGQALPTVTLDRADLLEWRGLQEDRDDAGKVRARWRDMGAARTRYAEAGSGEPVKTLRQTYPDQGAAQAAADAEYQRLTRGEAGIELRVRGRPELLAQTPFEVTGLRPELNGRWIAETVEHVQDYGYGGFTTRLTGARPAEA